MPAFPALPPRLGMLAALAIVALCGCSSGSGAPSAALASFSGDRILNHIRTFSSDEFEGRGPGSKGEQLTIKYLEDQFRSAGLEPGNPDGTYLQNVPLVGITPDAAMKLTLTGHGKTLEPKFQDDFVAWSKRVTETSAVDADLIFVGYGVQAPEFQWDDFKGVDVKGQNSRRAHQRSARTRSGAIPRSSIPKPLAATP